MNMNLRQGTAIASLTTLSAFAMLTAQSKQAPMAPQRVEVPASGPCYGQMSVAELKGLDLISAERARELAANAGLSACVDESRPLKFAKGPVFKIYAWPSQRDRVMHAIFGDKEFNKEAWGLPELQFEDLQLPEPYWIVPRVDSPTLKKAGVYDVVKRVVNASLYRAVARRRQPSAVVVAVRKPLSAWGDSVNYDLYFRFGKIEVERFQVTPVVGVFYAGRVDPLGVPFDLDQAYPFTGE